MKLGETMYAVVRSDGTVMGDGECHIIVHTQEEAEKEIEEIPKRFYYYPNDLRVVAVKLVEAKTQLEVAAEAACRAYESWLETNATDDDDWSTHRWESAMVKLREALLEMEQPAEAGGNRIETPLVSTVAALNEVYSREHATREQIDKAVEEVIRAFRGVTPSAPSRAG